jgi:hypothetical protein
MNVFKRLGLIAVIFSLSVPFDSKTATAYGQVSVIRKPAQEVIEALGRYVSRSGGRELTQELAEFGGEAAVRRVAEKAFREGGEDALNALVRTARSHGPDALRAADNAVNIPRLLRAVDDLPEEMAAQALRRLGAGAEGRVLAETVERFGAQTLRAEVKHPGIGGNLVRNLGEDGAAVAAQASRQQAITVSRHADDIARLPDEQRGGVLRMLREDFERMVEFMARFTEKNPGKVLFTVAATTVVLAFPDKVLGGEGEIIISPDGKPIYVPKPNAVERIVKFVIEQTLKIILPILAVAMAIWLGVKLWFHYRLTKLKHQIDTIAATANSIEPKIEKESNLRETQVQKNAELNSEKSLD